MPRPLLSHANGMNEIDRLLERMWAQVADWEQQGDHRSVFLTVYATMTGLVQRHMGQGAFMDAAWVADLTLEFAGLYFRWVEAYDRGGPVPRAWQFAFDLARRREAFVLQDALLGVNAHIVHDLAIAEAECLRRAGDVSLAGLTRRRFDHEQINRALVDAIPAVQVELVRRYARWLRPLDRAVRHLDERLTGLGLFHYRGRVWDNALWLAGARSGHERACVYRRLDTESMELAQQIYFAGALHLPLVRRAARWCRRWRVF